MSIFIGIAILFGVMFAIFSGAVGGDMSAQRHPHL